jgi:hypothetical protein
MKAKDYFEKYEPRFIADLVPDGEDFEEALLKAISDLVVEMNSEIKYVMEKRHCETPKAAVAVIREMNDKWNAIHHMFEKKYGSAPFKRDGLKMYWLKEMPELEPLL